MMYTNVQNFSQYGQHNSIYMYTLYEGQIVHVHTCTCKYTYICDNVHVCSSYSGLLLVIL